jgi:argininosuccinate lyase
MSRDKTGGGSAGKQGAQMKPWGGRFSKATDPSVERYTSSLAYDRRLAPYDLAGSRAHARMLAAQGILSAQDGDSILAGLDSVEREIADGAFDWRPSDEDVHMAIERRLTELVGEAGGKLHTARSRNDQVALDMRMFCRDHAKDLASAAAELIGALREQAVQHPEAVLPGYTHLQRAQPVLLAHHMAAHCYAFLRDIDRFRAAHDAADAMPLGAAALAGTTFPIDREMVAAELGFSRVVENSMDAVADRDFALDLLYACVTAALHVSRLAEEVVLWTSSEFGFATVDDGYATGSSIMPQKKNPDVAELARGKTGRVLGDLVALATVLKGLPLAYDRDLQEDKEAVFDSVETVSTTLSLMAALMRTMTWRQDRMLAAAEGGFATATELADYLTGKGLAFRQAHEIAGLAVKTCEERGCALAELSLADLRGLSPLIDEDVRESLSVASSVRRRKSQGGTAPERVAEQLEDIGRRVEAARSWAD